MVFIVSILTSCFNRSFIKKDINGEPTVEDISYSINYKMEIKDAKVIDTTALYLELFSSDANQSEKENPEILIFHNNGYFEKRSKKFFSNFEKIRTKKSVYYGGKFQLTNKELIIEEFYPTSGSKTNYYDKLKTYGIIKKDTVIIIFFNREYKYVKKRKEDIF